MLLRKGFLAVWCRTVGLVGCVLFAVSSCGGGMSAGASSSASSSSSSSASSSSTSSSSGSASFAYALEPWMAAGGKDFAPAVIENGVTLRDTNGNILHAHGAGMIKVGAWYYWYGENRYEDQSFKSVRLYRSRNLKDWQFVKDVLTDKSHSELNFAKIERPKIIYNPATRRYVMWMHKEGGDSYAEARAAVAVADTIDGDYRYLGSFRPLNYMSRDCTAYVDDDGKGYFLSAANENADLHLYRLTDDFTAVASLVQKIWVGKKREAPALVKRKGVYYLLTSGTSGWDPNPATYGVANRLGGPWSNPRPIGNKTTFDSQPTFILPIEGKNGTAYLYMGDRWLDPKYQDSKYVWLPLAFPGEDELTLGWSTRIAVDAQAGALAGSGVEEIRIQSKLSGKCLDVADESLKPRANLLQWGCSDNFNQRWRIGPVESGYFQLKALHSSQCLDVAAASKEDGANILQWPCNKSNNQLWRKQTFPDGSFSLVSKDSGKCLDVAKWSNDNGGNIQLWQCTGRDNQKWLEN